MFRKVLAGLVASILIFISWQLHIGTMGSGGQGTKDPFTANESLRPATDGQRSRARLPIPRLISSPSEVVDDHPSVDVRRNLERSDHGSGVRNAMSGTNVLGRVMEVVSVTPHEAAALAREEQKFITALHEATNAKIGTVADDPELHRNDLIHFHAEFLKAVEQILGERADEFGRTFEQEAGIATMLARQVEESTTRTADGP